MAPKVSMGAPPGGSDTVGTSQGLSAGETATDDEAAATGGLQTAAAMASAIRTPSGQTRRVVPTAQSPAVGTNPGDESQRAGTPEGHVQDLENEEETGEERQVTEQARLLKTIDDYQREIQQLMQQKEQLACEAAARNREI